LAPPAAIRLDLPPGQLKGFVKAEYDKWIKIVQDAGIRLD
jgi:tripartite-type tricarboxylate transporter receptor subunit TctC